ncbi:hypothetical protein, partial [Bacillus thuringiensis]|uniref:hypothetical protein n=1 Tax=Bacillus thuringiensis TaxID=1428 RepID=UPI001C3F47BC
MLDTLRKRREETSMWKVAKTTIFAWRGNGFATDTIGKSCYWSRRFYKEWRNGLLYFGGLLRGSTRFPMNLLMLVYLVQ